MRQKGKKVITPNERLARMRKSFARDKSVLTEDYKYFTTPDKEAKQMEEHERRPVKCHSTR
jgi:hypothetical protein